MNKIRNKYLRLRTLFGKIIFLTEQFMTDLDGSLNNMNLTVTDLHMIDFRCKIYEKMYNRNYQLKLDQISCLPRVAWTEQRWCHQLALSFHLIITQHHYKMNSMNSCKPHLHMLKLFETYDNHLYLLAKEIYLVSRELRL